MQKENEKNVIVWQEMGEIETGRKIRERNYPDVDLIN